MRTAYLIAGGGSGAKVVEAVTFLCASGMGPDVLNILLVDCDVANGNLTRTKSTVENYTELSQKPWRGHSEGKFKFPADYPKPFRTTINLSTLDKEISGMAKGLASYFTNNDGNLLPVLHLLFDETELANSFKVGFKGRPNVGSLLMAEHLRKHLLSSGTAGGFAAGLISDARRANHAKLKLPVAVVGSIFGGTGASLLPVTHDCIEEAFKRSEDGTAHFGALSWARFFLLPYFSPSEKVNNVNPDIFLYNASIALQHYSESEFDGETYVVGSNDFSRNKMRPMEGSVKQCNPGCLEEVEAAISVLAFMNKVTPEQPGPATAGATTPVPTNEFFGNSSSAAANTYMNALQDTSQVLEMGLTVLPLSPKQRSDFAYLLQLAAFSLRRCSKELEHSRRQHDRGLYAYLRLFVADKADRTPRAFACVPWFAYHILPWAKQLDLGESVRSSAERAEKLLEGTEAPCASSIEVKDALLGFFGRLLLWSNGVFNKRGVTAGITMNPEVSHFQSIHGTMCLKHPLLAIGADVERDDIHKDNVLVRSCRIALAAMWLEHKENRRGRRGVKRFNLWTKEKPDKVVALALDEAQITEMLTNCTSLEANLIADGYRAGTLMMKPT